MCSCSMNNYSASFAYGMQVWWSSYLTKLLVHKNSLKNLSISLEVNGITALQSVTRHS